MRWRLPTRPAHLSHGARHRAAAQPHSDAQVALIAQPCRGACRGRGIAGMLSPGPKPATRAPQSGRGHALVSRRLQPGCGARARPQTQAPPLHPLAAQLQRCECSSPVAVLPICASLAAAGWQQQQAASCGTTSEGDIHVSSPYILMMTSLSVSYTPKLSPTYGTTPITEGSQPRHSASTPSSLLPRWGGWGGGHGQHSEQARSAQQAWSTQRQRTLLPSPPEGRMRGSEHARCSAPQRGTEGQLVAPAGGATTLGVVLLDSFLVG